MSILFEQHIDFPKEILIRRFIGKVDLDSILNSWEDLLNNHIITPELKGVINDLSKCDLQLNMETFEKLTRYLKTKDQLKRLKLAVLCNTPRIIVFPIMGEKTELELKIKPFTEEESAVHWIIHT